MLQYHQFKFKEVLYLEDEEGNIVAGKKGPSLKVGIVSFFRENVDSDWKVRAVVNPYILTNTEA